MLTQLQAGFFYTWIMCLKNIAQIEYKISIQNSVFPGFRGLTASTYIVYNCNTNGHKDL